MPRVAVINAGVPLPHMCFAHMHLMLGHTTAYKDVRMPAYVGAYTHMCSAYAKPHVTYARTCRAYDKRTELTTQRLLGTSLQPALHAVLFGFHEKIPLGLGSVLARIAARLV